VDGDDGDLSVGFFVDLTADVAHLRGGVRVEYVGEVVDVAGGLELRDRLGMDRSKEQQYDDGRQPAFLKVKHAQQNCTGGYRQALF